MPELVLPETIHMIVDRSPELLRNAVAPGTALHVPKGKTLQRVQFDVSPFEGTPGDPEGCPIAIAMGRLFDVTEMHLAGEKPWFKTRDGVTHQMELSADLALWVGRFDRHEPVLPFEMTLQYLR